MRYNIRWETGSQYSILSMNEETGANLETGPIRPLADRSTRPSRPRIPMGGLESKKKTVFSIRPVTKRVNENHNRIADEVAGDQSTLEAGELHGNNNNSAQLRERERNRQTDRQRDRERESAPSQE